MIISNFKIFGAYMVDMLNKVGLKAEFLYDDPIGINPWKVKRFTQTLKDFNIIHFISGYQRVKFMIWLHFVGKKIVNHWIGTDVSRAINDFESNLLARITNHIIDIQLSEWLPSTKELKKAGIKASFLPIIPQIDENAPITYKSGVLIYIPEDRVNFHHGHKILELAKAFPNTKFQVVDNKGDGLPALPNIHYHGWVEDMEKIWSNISILIRFPKHDGLSFMVLEALTHGKWVIWNQSMPYCSYVKKISDISYELKSLLDKKSPNLEGRKFVLTKFNTQKVGKKYIEFYNSLIS